MVKVIKRNGISVDFNKLKIKTAISKANIEVGNEMTDAEIDRITNLISEKIDNNYKDTITVEQIQDLVEEELVSKDEYKVAKAYIIYRYKRIIARGNTTDHDVITMVRGENKEMNEENSNKNTVLASTLREYIAGIVSRDIANRLLLP